jgi:hypothetical protein
MTTCKPPWKVLRSAHDFGGRHLPSYASEFSRKDFTEAQRFACLVPREHQKKSYRGIQALLEDSPNWLADIGMTRAPDHNTLRRAFKRLMKPALVKVMPDDMAESGRKNQLIRRSRIKPLALDSTMTESRHLSRHDERRQKETRAKKTPRKQRRKRIVSEAGS